MNGAPTPTDTAITGELPMLTDSFGRRIDHLRLSVTSACDLQCVYCRPDRRERPAGPPNALSDAKRIDFIRYLHDRCGLTHVRLTDGEPLVYPSLAGLIEGIRRTCPHISIAVTTNGRLLAGLAPSLRDAGLDRLNVSLDSLDEACYRRTTGGRLADVLRGLGTAGTSEGKIRIVNPASQADPVISLATRRPYPAFPMTRRVQPENAPDSM